MSPRGRAATFTWSGGLSSVAVAGGLALGTGDRGSELAAVLQQLEGPSPTGGGPDPAGVSGPGGARSRTSGEKRLRTLQVLRRRWPIERLEQCDSSELILLPSHNFA